MLEFLMTIKSKPKLHVDGHLYVREKSQRNKSFWKCEMYTKNKCNVRITTIDNRVYGKIGEHNHVADIARVEALRARNMIAERARNTRLTPQQIIDDVSAQLPEDVLTHLAMVDSMKRTINKQRRRALGAAAPANTRRKLVISEDFQISAKDADFLMKDCAQQEESSCKDAAAANHHEETAANDVTPSIINIIKEEVLDMSDTKLEENFEVNCECDSNDICVAPGSSSPLPLPSSSPSSANQQESTHQRTDTPIPSVNTSEKTSQTCEQRQELEESCNLAKIDVQHKQEKHEMEMEVLRMQLKYWTKKYEQLG